MGTMIYSRQSEVQVTSWALQLVSAVGAVLIAYLTFRI